MTDALLLTSDVVILTIVILSPAILALVLIVSLEFTQNRSSRLIKRGYTRGFENGRHEGYLQGVRDARPPHWGPYR